MALEASRRFRTLWLMTVLGLMLAACSVVSVDQKTRYRDAEGYFEPNLLEQIKPGETSQTWLVKHFGHPWFSEVDGLEGYPVEVGIHTWRFERELQKSTRVLLLFRSRKLNQQYEYLHVVTDGDTVKRSWRDELATVDIRRLMAAMGYRKAQVEAHTAPEESKPTAASSAEAEAVPPPTSLVVEDVPPKEPESTEKAPAAEPDLSSSDATSL